MKHVYLLKQVAVFALGIFLATGNVLASPDASPGKTPDTDIQQVVKRRLTGTVNDSSGPVIGASVSIKGTYTGTSTDANGKYSLDVSDGQTVIITMLGYVTQEIEIGTRTNIDVMLETNTHMVDEVVVTALGMTRDKKALGYAMTELAGEELARSNVVNPINALQGKVAGVQIDMGAAGPQSSQRIIIRGNTSMSGNNQPIFIVDGIIIDNEVSKTGDKFDRDFGNELKSLNSDDFESVSVLKGAAATALYGSRASNGVILITTKKGKKSEGLGVSFSHTQQWENIYDFMDFQNQFGMGTNPAWPLNADGTQNRNIEPGRNFGPAYDYQPYTVSGIYEGIHQPYNNNLKGLFRDGHYVNTNVAVSGGTDRSTFRFSYSNMSDEGTSLNNKMTRDNLMFKGSQEIGKYLTAEASFTYTNIDSKNPTYQGGDRSPVYDFAYSVPRDYDTHHWLKNYWNENRDGWNANDPFGYSATLFDYLENNELQQEELYRGYVKLDIKFTDWLKVVLNGDMNRTYTKREKKTFATENSDYRGAEYTLRNSQKLQYRLNAMVTANRQFGDFNVGAYVGAETFDEKHSFHYSQTNNGLRLPGIYELSNSVNPATTDAMAKNNTKRINTVFGAIQADWKGQVFMEVTGRNDWSSTLRYSDGSGNVSYFYPSVNASWILTETLRHKLPSAISFFKIRASYAIVGKDSDPYFINDPGTYLYYNSFTDDYYKSGTHPYFQYANSNLGAVNLKPEKQHAIEFGLDFRMFNNRFGIDFAYYKTNTKNQILALPVSAETGVSYRIINAGNIQNAGIELLLTGTPIQTRDWNWDISLNLTRNRNKIKDLYPGVTKYQLPAGAIDTEAWATVGGSYGDIYTSFGYARDDEGNKLLNLDGSWKRSGTSEKIGSLQPDFLAGFTSSLQWKGFNFSFVIDSRFGGDIFSASYNYGMSGGRLSSSLYGRTEELGGLPRTYTDTHGNVFNVNDGMIPDGVFAPGIKSKGGADLGGMSYKDAYEAGHVDPVSASNYYYNLYSWATGIREASLHKLTWVSLREISLTWNLPNKWTEKAFVKDVVVGFNIRNVGYLYNSLPDNIYPEGLINNYSSQFVEAGGRPYSRRYGFTVKFNF